MVFVLIARFGYTDGDSLLYIKIVIFNQNELLTPFFFNENVLLTHTPSSNVLYVSHLGVQTLHNLDLSSYPFQ